MLRSPELLGSVASAVCAVAAYVNTLPASFAFDDSLAVLSNGDVTNDDKPVWELFQNDFWGQNIRSPQSHKSYRPLTVLSFRLTRHVWQALPAAWTAPMKAWRAFVEAALSNESDPSKRAPATDIDPLLFHAANVALHALASGLVCLLAYHLFAKRMRLGPRSSDGGRSSGGGDANNSPADAAVEDVLAGDGAAQVAGPKAGSPARHAGGGGGLRRRKGSGVHGTGQSPAAERDAADEADSSHGLSLDDKDRGMGVAGGMGDILGNLLELHVPAWFTGVAFALHPVHTEAVAGVVGHAELLCAVLSIPALLLYCTAADADGGGGSGAQGRTGQRTHSHRPGASVLSAAGAVMAPPHTCWGHWVRVVLALVMAWMAALSKEIGITIIGGMLAYDVLLVPMTGTGAQPGVGGGGGRRKWLRMGLAAAAAVAYVHMRSLVAGDQLVRIYRKVENPIAFAPDATTRALSMLHLHALYAQLLLWPARLSADWSFACVQLVTGWADPRNAASVALYATLLMVVLLARPWDILLDWARAVRGSSSSSSSGLGHARWRAAVAGGLVVAPFFPASNALFYVGTYIGERLMYMPSIGFLLLFAELGLASGLAGCLRTAGVAARARPSHQASAYLTPGCSGASGVQAPSGSTGGEACGGKEAVSTGVPATQDMGWRTRLLGLLALLGAAVLSASAVGLLAWYAGRTVARNWEWLNEEALFVSAQRVCGASAKVQLNSGILARRRGNLPAALAHFESARAIEPGYCEPGYWLGVTALNLGDVHRALTELEASVACKYVAADALRTLNTIYAVLRNANPKDGLALARWGAVLVRPHVMRVGEGCEALESAAVTYALARDLSGALSAVKVCEDALAGRHQGAAVPAGERAVVGTDTVLAALSMAQLAECVAARRPVISALGNHGPSSPYARTALYAYLSWVNTHAPQCRGGAPPLPSGRDLGAPSRVAAGEFRHTPHMVLVHSVQAVDAEDAWLHLEWGEVLAGAPGRAHEAATHLSVAGILLGRQLAALAAGQHPTLLGMDGRLLDEGTTRAGIAVAYEKAAAAMVLSAEGPGRGAVGTATGACDMLLQGLEARAAALRLTSVGEEARATHALALEAGARVLAARALRGSAECQAAALRLRGLSAAVPSRSSVP